MFKELLLPCSDTQIAWLEKCVRAALIQEEDFLGRVFGNDLVLPRNDPDMQIAWLKECINTALNRNVEFPRGHKFWADWSVLVRTI